MPANTESSKRKLSFLQLAEEPGNVSKACRIMGYYRDTFYEVRHTFQIGGGAALVEKKRGLKGPIQTVWLPKSRYRYWLCAWSVPLGTPSASQTSCACRR